MTRHKWAAFTVMALAQIADAVSTRLALAQGGIELNPVVRMLGLGQTKFLALAVAAIVVYRLRTTWLLWAGCAVYAAIYAAVVLSNAQLITP